MHGFSHSPPVKRKQLSSHCTYTASLFPHLLRGFGPLGKFRFAPAALTKSFQVLRHGDVMAFSKSIKLRMIHRRLKGEAYLTHLVRTASGADLRSLCLVDLTRGEER